MCISSGTKYEYTFILVIISSMISNNSSSIIIMRMIYIFHNRLTTAFHSITKFLIPWLLWVCTFSRWYMIGYGDNFSLNLNKIFSQWFRRGWLIIIIILLSQYCNQSQFHYIVMVNIWSVTNIIKAMFQERSYTTIATYYLYLVTIIVNIINII